MKTKRILITGACGSVGTKLTEAILKESHVVCAFDNNEDGLFELKKQFQKKYPNNLKLFLGDIRDQKRVSQAHIGVDEVYHCAALKHVELNEYNPFETLNTNVLGTQNIINAAIENKVSKVLLTSSDKAVNPSSMMGATKLLAEKLIISANNFSGTDEISFGCLRFGNVWNTNGSVGKIFKTQILNSENISVTSKEMTRFFITLDNAISLCIEAMNELIGGEIFVSDMGGTSIGKLAESFQKIAPNTEIIEIGIKPGEKLYEELFTDVESTRTFLYKDMYVVLPENLDAMSTRYRTITNKYNNPIKKNIALRSDSEFAKQINTDYLVKQIMG